MEILLDIDTATSVVSDANGHVIGILSGAVGFPQQECNINEVRILEPSEFCQLLGAGLTEEDIKRLMKEKVIG